MHLLTNSSLLSETIGTIYDCVLDPAKWEPTLSGLAAQIGARRASLGVMSAAGENRGQTVALGFEGIGESEAGAALNPLTPAALLHPVDRAYVASRDFGLPTLKATRFYREVLAPRGDIDCIAFVIMRDGDAFAHWILITQDDRAPISADEVAGFELVAPHLRRAVEISNLFGLRKLECETYRTALGHLDATVMILDAERRPVYANPRAEAEIARGDVFRLSGGRVTGATSSAEAALRRVVRGRLAGGAGGFEAAVQASTGEEKLLFAVSLDADGNGLFGAPGRLTMLVLRAPREDTRNPITIAARLFNLTPAQVQVLHFLAQGHTPDEISDLLGITAATVRSHLADLFRRTGTARQAELVARALSLASPLRPLKPH